MTTAQITVFILQWCQIQVREKNCNIFSRIIFLRKRCLLGFKNIHVRCEILIPTAWIYEAKNGAMAPRDPTKPHAWSVKPNFLSLAVPLLETTLATACSAGFNLIFGFQSSFFLYQFQLFSRFTRAQDTGGMQIAEGTLSETDCTFLHCEQNNYFSFPPFPGLEFVKAL